MPALLTTASVMMCPHGGTVTAVSANTVTAGGAPILRGSDTFIIAGCVFAPGGVPSPCISINWVTTAQQVSCSAPVLNEASVGLCAAATQAVQGTALIASTQPQVSGL
jgi:hypothetical protein